MRKSTLLFMLLNVALIAVLAALPAGAKVLPHQPGPSTGIEGAGKTRAFGFDHPQLTYTKLIDAGDVTIRQVGVRPQGDRIVYSSTWDSSGVTKREIYIADPDGTNPVLISPGGSGLGGVYGYMNPMWSKDGSKVGFLKVFYSEPNKVISYDFAGGTRTFIYEPVTPLDVANFDYLGDSNTDIVFWDWNYGTGEGDLFTYVSGVRTNITNTADYSEYEPNSDITGTKILFWSGEMPAEPCDTTHLLTWTGSSWVKDLNFTPIINSYWAFWAYAGYGPQDLRVCLTKIDSFGSCVESTSRDIEIWSEDGVAKILDVTGPYYPGSSSWNFFGCNPVHRDGSIYFGSNDDNPSPGRDVYRAVASSVVGLDPVLGLAKCDDPSASFDVTITDTPAIRGYEIRIELDETKLALSDTPPYGIVEGSFLDNTDPATFQVFKHAEGSYQIAGVILGSTAGAAGSGVLFTVTGDPIAEADPSVSIDLYGLKLRDPDNQPVFGNPTDGELQVDCTDPCVTSVEPDPPGTTCWTTAPTIVVDGTEAPSFGRVVALWYQYQLAGEPCDDGSWLLLADGLSLASPWSHTATPGAAPGVPGTYRIWVMAEDEAGNLGLCACAGSYEFDYNPTPPTVQVTDLIATPGHRDVQLTWTTPSLAGAEEVVLIRKTTSGDYPEYLTDTAYPTSLADGDEVYRGTGSAATVPWGTGDGDQDISERSIYLFRAFVTSCAGTLASDGRVNLRDDYVAEDTTDGTDAAVNYWLGDLDDQPSNSGFGGPYDGYVTATDLVLFSGEFGLSVPPGDSEADYGPTVMPPLSVQGIPKPDGEVDFEDLILLAINFGNVAPLQGELPVMVDLGDAGSGPIRLDVGPVLSRVRVGETIQVPVVIHGNVERVQGIRTVLSYDEGQLAYESVEISGAVADAPHFFRGLTAAGQIDLNLALLGQGAGLHGEGAIFMVRFRVLRGGPIQLSLSGGKVRDTANHELLGLAPGDREDPAILEGRSLRLPADFLLGDAQPNPFNPRTLVTFDIPRNVHVRLVIYDVAGRLVRTLVNAEQPAGRHRVEWDGKDDTGRAVKSGTYFYTMRAADYRSQRRMTLLK